jgi:hypothetical protein
MVFSVAQMVVSFQADTNIMAGHAGKSNLAAKKKPPKRLVCY